MRLEQEIQDHSGCVGLFPLHNVILPLVGRISRQLGQDTVLSVLGQNLTHVRHADIRLHLETSVELQHRMEILPTRGRMTGGVGRHPLSNQVAV
jgi:hypothetical protein